MDIASKILILGGLLNIAYGLLTGIPAAMIRQKEASYSKYLRFVHVGSLLWGPTLMSLTLALGLSNLDATVETIAAILMLVASIFLGAKDTLNWRLGIQDEFAQKPRLPLLLGALSSLASFLGIAIIFFGAIMGALA